MKQPLLRVGLWAFPFVVALPAALFVGSCAQDSNTTAVGGGGYTDPDAAAGGGGGSGGSDSGKPDVKPDVSPDTGVGGSSGGGGTGGDGGTTQCVPKTCQQLGAECGNAPDGCGGKLSCGTCQTGKTCGGGGTNKCGTNACVAKTCIQVGASCGYASDGCADVVDCGGCPAPGSCGGGGKENQCGCTPKTCLQLGASCGSVPDGCGGKVDCGACGAGETCGGSGIANKCGAGSCAAKTCSQLGASCGFISDGCGVALDCGKCADPNTCGGGGTQYQCGCAVKTCIQLGASCGPMPNGCGQTIDCGTCPSGEVCGGAGVAHQCGCKCTIPHAIATCSKGVCSLASCETGWTDCDGDKVNGCETNTGSDMSNCGGCGAVCAYDHAAETCSNSTCQMGACEAGWSDCNANTTDGCEQIGDVQHCGSCTNDCSALSLPHVTGPACNAGQCAIGTCETGYVDQNGTTGDGCECAADPASAACGTASTLGPDPFPLGGSATAAGTLVPNGQNDYYIVKFSGNNSCSYHPKVTLSDTSGTGLIRLQVTTDCATALACTEGGTSDNVTEWEFTLSGACGTFAALDLPRYPAEGTMYIRVYAAGASATCLPYTVTVTN